MLIPKLTKSVRTYLKLSASPTFWDDKPGGTYRECYDYLGSLYQEFGRAAVRAEIERQRG